MNRKGLLYLTNHPGLGDHWTFDTTGHWNWLPARSTQQASDLILAHQPHVGVVDFLGADQSAYAGWHDDILHAHGDIHWVAVIPSRRLSDPRFASYLSARFYAYQTAPLCSARLEPVLASAEDMAKLRIQRRRGLPMDGLIGTSLEMSSLRRQIARCADAGHPILITGEVGSGKSAAARAVHYYSNRQNQVVQKIRCIGFPDLDACSESAWVNGSNSCTAAGIVRTMREGTLVLDEVADLSLSAQQSLMRLLDQPPGRLHLIALSHMDLAKAVAENRFRADLLQRLSDVHLVTPPLRDRGDDVEQLARHFLGGFWHLNRHVTGLSNSALQSIQQHTWPGNVRELRCRIRRAMLLSDDRFIYPEDLGFGRRLRVQLGCQKESGHARTLAAGND